MANKKPFIEALEEESTEQLEEVRALRQHRGKQTFDEYMKRAKIACVVIGSYVRLRATMANEETNKLVAKRLETSLPGSPLTLPAPENERRS